MVLSNQAAFLKSGRILQTGLFVMTPPFQEMTMQVTTSYLVCATPRSGSTLLCEALQNTDIAGCPAEYFEALRQTGLPRRPKQYFEDHSATELENYFEGFPHYDEQAAQPTR